MICLYIVVEGKTELEFVKRTLGPYLSSRHVFAIPIEVGTKRDRETGAKLGRGGGHWKQWERDIRILTRQHSETHARFTTLFDLYGLPRDFPELSLHCSVSNTVRRVELLETAMAACIKDPRFIPYLQRHEIESLVLAGLDMLEDRFDEPTDQKGIGRLRLSLEGLQPEDVNDGPDTHPSMRLKQAASAYRKALHGPDVLATVGIDALRAKCPRFNAWVSKLEALGGEI